MLNLKKAIFLGSKEFGLNIFKSVFESDTSINWKVLTPDDSQDARSNLKNFQNFTQSNKLDLITVDSPSKVQSIVDEFAPEIMLVIGYYRILPQEIIDSIDYGVWGIHNSLLPKYRGGSPLVWQLINGEEEVGSSFFRFSSGMDDGKVLHQVKFINKNSINIDEAMKNIEKLWVDSLPIIWKNYLTESIFPYEQNHDLATYCSQRKEQDGIIDWSLDAYELDRFIRSQSKPYPMAFFYHADNLLRIYKHEVDNRTIYGSPGQVFEVKNSYVTICCGNNTALRLIKVELENDQYPANKFLNSIKIRL